MKLGVNIDHVATLRNARGGEEPSILSAGYVCDELNVSAITVHLREDRRHIKDNDVWELKRKVKTHINLEMATNEEIQKIALDIVPYSVCLVPERRQELTTEGGLDVYNNLDKMKKFIAPLKEKGIIVSLFIDPNENQVKASAEAGAEFIELHTGSFSLAQGEEVQKEFEKLKTSAELAQSLGLKVNAGHGLNYENVHYMHKIPNLIELNIGHSIISRAVFTGLKTAISDMQNLIR